MASTAPTHPRNLPLAIRDEVSIASLLGVRLIVQVSAGGGECRASSVGN